MKNQAFQALFLVCFTFLVFFPFRVIAQQSAEAGEWILESPTPRGPKTYTIKSGKSHIAVGLANGTKVRGRVSIGTDSTLTIGSQEVMIEDIRFVEGTLGRSHLNYWWILVPLIATFLCLASLAIVIWIAISGFALGASPLIGLIFGIALPLGLYGTIPALVLLVDGVSRFLKRLFIPKPYNWTRSPSQLKS
jgi:hypothetical protein